MALRSSSITGPGQAIVKKMQQGFLARQLPEADTSRPPTPATHRTPSASLARSRVRMAIPPSMAAARMRCCSTGPSSRGQGEVLGPRTVYRRRNRFAQYIFGGQIACSTPLDAQMPIGGCDRLVSQARSQRSQVVFRLAENPVTRFLGVRADNEPAPCHCDDADAPAPTVEPCRPPFLLRWRTRRMATPARSANCRSGVSASRTAWSLLASFPRNAMIGSITTSFARTAATAWPISARSFGTVI